MSEFVSRLLGEIKQVLPMVESIYKDLHQNPELALQEVCTAGIVAQKCAKLITK
ncbi:MAG: hypothetical protein P4L44_06730 [Oryzomonas sp.]|uniref:hypothetical protein n=1 Tax=Oryzomonas sp. TaxID=2855186 RepID=UPI00283DBE1A|nr:hypothetical protein [Oryzomonas sp.]MDR3579638.1 hypothetical protein [Oryzomonas sp.]